MHTTSPNPETPAPLLEPSTTAKRGIDDSVLPWILLVLATLLVLWASRGFWGPVPALGDDASSHTTAIATLAEALRNGDPWWSNDYNAGFPLGLYYQPLPHVASAIVCAILGGHAAAPLTYKLLLSLMMLLQPWTIFLGLRRAGLGRLEAAFAGLMAPMILNGIDFGYHSRASLKVGLYTQAWGNVALPLAFGELAAIARGQGRVGRAIVACALVASTHMFYAIAIAVPAVLFSLAGGAWRRAAVQLPLAGVGTFVVLAPWMVPLSLNQAFFGGWPFGRPSRVHGYGWAELFAKFKTGELMDADQLPILTTLVVIGIVVALVLAVRHPLVARRKASLFALILLLWSCVGYAGREGVGVWIDRLNPLHHNVQLFRYGSFLQFSALVLAGIALGGIVRLLARWVPGRIGAWLAVGAGVAALALPMRAGLEQMEDGFRTLDKASGLRMSQYQEVTDWLRENAREGRMYVGKRSGLRGHYHSGFMAWGANRPAAQSYGVGLHDSLHFYTLEYLRPDFDHALDLADLFDFRIMVHSHSADLSGMGELETLFENRRYVVSRLQVSGNAVETMREAETVQGTPRGVRQDIRAWMRGNGPGTRQTVVVEIDEPRSREGLTSAPRAPRRSMQFPDAEPPGRTLESEQQGGRFHARVELDEPGLIVAKIGYHPFWRVTLDGEPAETVFAFPGFLAVRAGPGEHVIQGIYAWPLYSRVLLVLSPTPLFWAFIGVPLWRRRRDRQAQAQVIASASPQAGSGNGDEP